MTTLVTVATNPGPGMRTRIEIKHKGGGPNTVVFMKNNDVPRQFAAAHDMSVEVSEEKDEPMVEVPGNELREPGEI